MMSAPARSNPGSRSPQNSDLRRRLDAGLRGAAVPADRTRAAGRTHPHRRRMGHQPHAEGQETTLVKPEVGKFGIAIAGGATFDVLGGAFSRLRQHPGHLSGDRAAEVQRQRRLALRRRQRDPALDPTAQASNGCRQKAGHAPRGSLRPRRRSHRMRRTADRPALPGRHPHHADRDARPRPDLRPQYRGRERELGHGRAERALSAAEKIRRPHPRAPKRRCHYTLAAILGSRGSSG